MSRGWDRQAVSRILLEHQQAKQPRAQARSKKFVPEKFDPFIALCVAHGLPKPEREAAFIEGRQFRADYLFREARVIVERQGGLFSKNARAQKAHAMPLKILRDYEKSNLAQLAGYTYLQFTPDQLDNGVCLPELKILLGRGVGARQEP